MSQGLSRLFVELALDLGTSTTHIYQRGRGLVADAPTLVAAQRGESAPGAVVAIGEAAQDMLGRTPDSIVVTRPVANGVIADFAMAEALLEGLLRQQSGRGPFGAPKLLIAAPEGLTEVERKALHESARAAGCREVRLVSQAIAAAVGAGLPILEPRGSMLVDIGGGVTHIAVLCIGGLAASRRVRVAGDRLTQAIVEHVEARHGLQIGTRTAELLKHELATLDPQAPVEARQAPGRDLRAGRPGAVVIRSDELRQALLPVVGELVEAIRGVLEQVSPELAGDILDQGIVLCGGGALLRGLDHALRDQTGIPFVVAEDPAHCVVLGAGALLEQPELLQRVSTG